MAARHNSFILALALCLNAFFMQAQQPETAPKNELDNKYTPNASSIFNTMKKSGDGISPSNVDITFKQGIKFYPFTLFRQKVYMSYEREIVKGFAVDLGVGKSFGNDLLQNVFLTSLSSFDVNNVLTPENALGNSTYNGSWPLLSGGVKIYFTGNTFEEAFMEVNYRYEKTNYLLNTTIDGNRIDGENDLVFNMQAFNVGFGYTGVSGSKNNFIHQFYLNFGAKLFNYTRYDQQSVKKFNGSGNEVIYVKSAETLSVRIIPAVNIGYCFGFGL